MLRVWDLATGRELYRAALPELFRHSFGYSYVHALALAPNGRQATTSLADATLLVWDLALARPPAPLLDKPPETKELAGWWADLAAADGAQAYAAFWRMTEAGDATTVFLDSQVQPVREDNQKQVGQFLEDLDSDHFEARATATKKLAELGEVIQPALRKALEANPSPEVRRRLESLLAKILSRSASPVLLQRFRAIQTLEQIGSPAASRLLRELADGMPQASETREAREALDRLGKDTKR